MLTVVGGVYRELCMRPRWDEVYGSAGRAAEAITTLGGSVTLHTYLDSQNEGAAVARAAIVGFSLTPTKIAKGVTFYYTHGLITPTFWRPPTPYAAITIAAEKVVRFGMIEGSAVIDAQYAVYDPQNVHNPESFGANGSTAKHLALVLNRYEAKALSGLIDATAEDMAIHLSKQEKAEVVIIKMGPMGALVYANNVFGTVPAYSTSNVWKIGTGDQFVANFSYAWLEEGRTALEAADRASRATAYYCENSGFPTKARLDAFSPTPISVSAKYKAGDRPLVYVAGPFFTLAQLWLVDQVVRNLKDMGLRVFSPYHDVGLGSAEDVVEKDLQGIRDCDLLFAIGDGLDSGTIYEVGYARALNKPVILYSENESTNDKKMMEGSDCHLADDYVTAIYQTVWTAVAL